MTRWAILDALKSGGGVYEITRVLGAFGTVTFVVSALTFVATGHFGEVSLTEFSMAFPAAVVTLVGVAAGVAGWKDGKLAGAKRIEAEARASEAVSAASEVDTARRVRQGDKPQEVEVVNKPSKPVPTREGNDG